MNMFNDAIKQHKDGAIINLFVTPKSKCSFFPAGYNQYRKRIEIKVTSDAQDNKANNEVLKIISEFFNKSIQEVSIISGQKIRKKSVLIKNISVDKITRIMKESLNGL